MRSDVLNLILGWTLLALILPLILCGVITAFLDGWVLAVKAFLPAIVVSAGLGACMLGFFTRTDSASRLRDLEAFVGVGLVWPLTVFIGSLPYWFGGVFVGPLTPDAASIDIARGFVNSWFESMSGFTTSGATVISHNMSPNCIPGVTEDCINAQPRGLLLWRSLTQWLGGMGVVMLGMLVLSRIIGGGMALARAELTGPSLSRLRPKLRQTAIALWGLYLVLTLIEMFALKFIGGMTFFDSINHAFTTMPSGGFSTRDASIAFYDSEVIEIIIIVFMFLAGVNFTLMWLVGAGNWRSALKDEEFRTYLFYIFSAVSIIVLSLVLVGVSAGQATIDTLFHVLSIGTSTGYASADYGAWPGVARIILFLLMIVGACAGSTSGGLKLMRIRIGVKVAFRELARIAQPRKIHMIRMNKEVVEDKQVSLVVGMLFIWVLLFGFSCIVLALMMPDASFETIFSVAASGLGNTGPALGDYGPTSTWAGMNSGSLVFTSILMWFGRLELLTAIIVLHPHSWRKEEKADGERQGMAMVKRILDREDSEDQNNVI
jgi:trk system potassium uptake protein TrkH